MEEIIAKRRSFSNIAIVKYWGKKNGQLPENPSVSFTLDNVYTDMDVSISPKKSVNDKIILEFLYNNKPKPEFEPKMINFLNQAKTEFNWLKDYELKINSYNNFPHSSGIASSASSMSALALCIADIEQVLNQTYKSEKELIKKAGFWSRVGSGSACRSVYGGFSEWGFSEFIEHSSDLYPIKLEEIHPVFNQINDWVLIVDESSKAVSSSKGHQLLENHPFASSRFKQARENIPKLLNALKNGDINEFGNIAEEEALSLHAMMMTSNPGFILLKPNTLILIEKIRTFRNATGIPVYFTLDAGPNIHLLFFQDNFETVSAWIKKELVGYCQNELYFCNTLGNGPVKTDIDK